LDRLRTGWLNPPEWTREEVLEFPGSASGPWASYIDPAAVVPVPMLRAMPSALRGHDSGQAPRMATQSGGHATRANADSRGIGTVRYPRRVPNSDEAARELAKRTLTNLYNQRPTWLALAHQKLDSAVFAAYGWPNTLTDDEILGSLLALNLQRAGLD